MTSGELEQKKKKKMMNEDIKKRDIKFIRNIVKHVGTWGEAKKEEGFIPTTDLFVSEMTEYLEKLDVENNG